MGGKATSSSPELIGNRQRSAPSRTSVERRGASGANQPISVAMAIPSTQAARVWHASKWLRALLVYPALSLPILLVATIAVEALSPNTGQRPALSAYLLVIAAFSGTVMTIRMVVRDPHPTLPVQIGMVVLSFACNCFALLLGLVALFSSAGITD